MHLHSGDAILKLSVGSRVIEKQLYEISGTTINVSADEEITACTTSIAGQLYIAKNNLTFQFIMLDL